MVLGIVGMHAIGLHGSQHGETGSGPSDASAMSLMSPMSMEHDAPMVAMPRPHGQSEVDARGGNEVATLVSPRDLGHGMAGMTMLCVAVLVGATLAQMLTRSRHGRRLPLRERVMTSLHVTRPTVARQTRPPMVWAFSVIRC